MNHITKDPITNIRILTTTRDKLRSMFPELSYPAIIEVLTQYYQENSK